MSTVLIFFLPFLVVAGLAVTVFVFAWRRKPQRRRDLALWSVAQGLDFSIPDPHRLDRLDFRLFSRGDGRGCENVAAGDWQGLDVRVADYWYYDDDHDSDGGSSRTYHRFSIVLAGVEASLPAVQIERENALSRLADRLALRDLQFESEDFNRRFEVRADDREFAYKLLDARMMEWLLHTAGPHCYEVSGPWVLGYCKQLPPSELGALLDAVKGFLAQVPRLVWADYGKGAP